MSTVPNNFALPAGWEEVTQTMTRACTIWDIYGDSGSGRTHLALTAPGPIALLHCSEKVDGIAEKFIGQGKRIVKYNFGTFIPGANRDETAKNANLVWDKFLAKLEEGYKYTRTIVIDTHTDLWELIRYSYFGAIKPEKGRVDANYGPVNAEMDNVLSKRFKSQNRTNLILIGKTGDEYTKKDGKSEGMGERTGRTIEKGYKNVGFMSDVRVRTSRDVLRGGPFTATIEKGWTNATIEGIPFTEDTGLLSFPGLMGLITGDPAPWSK